MVQKNLAKVNSQRDLGLALAAFLIAFVLWQVQGLGVLLYPFRLFVTMIHELGHGTAAILTGGSFLRFEVSEQGAGLAYTSVGESRQTAEICRYGIRCVDRPAHPALY